MNDYLMLILADLFLAGNFAISRMYQKRAGTSLRAGFLFSLLTGGCTALIFWIYNGFRFAISLFSVGMAVLLALLGTSYTLLGFRIMKRQGISLYTLFLMTGGMTVPYLFGLLFLDESFSLLRTVGLLLIIASVFFSVSGKDKPDRTSIFLCIIVFFLNGGVSVVSKLHSIQTSLAVAPEEFVVLSSLVSTVVNLILLFTLKDPPERRNEFKEKRVSPLALLLLPLACAAMGGISSVLQLKGAQTIDASLLYPFITGGSIAFSSLVGILFFREKPTRGMCISILLAIIGTLFFLNFKELLL